MPDVVHAAFRVILIPREQHILFVVADAVGVVAEVGVEDGDLAIRRVVVAFDDGAGVVGQRGDVHVGVVGEVLGGDARAVGVIVVVADGGGVDVVGVPDVLLERVGVAILADFEDLPVLVVVHVQGAPCPAPL
jgi:hypothetical protein